MSLTDVMSHAGLSGYAEAALLLFLIAFVVIVARLYAPGRRADHERAAQLPLDDGAPLTPRTGASDEPASR